MRYTVDLLIHKNSDLFHNIRDKFRINHIDSYMISGILGYLNDYSLKDNIKVEEPAHIPRSVLTNRNHKLNFLWSVIYILTNKDKYNEYELLRNAFETNDEELDKSYLSIERVKLFHKYALGGIEILHKELIENADVFGKSYVDNLICFIDKFINISNKLNDLDLIED